MKERPILFSGPMVRAILDGRKTQTRRVVKFPQSVVDEYDVHPSQAYDSLMANDGGGAHFLVAGDHGYTSCVNCPFGQPGDRLWVRETFADAHPCVVVSGRFSKPSSAGIPGPPPVSYRVVYRADGEVPDVEHIPSYPYRRVADGLNEAATERHVWRPSIFMPRWASRIALEVTDVRAERLQDVSESDILAEGVTVDRVAEWTGTSWSDMPTLHEAWCVLWDSINAKRGYPWASNPWVWAVTFRRIQP